MILFFIRELHLSFSNYQYVLLFTNVKETLQRIFIVAWSGFEIVYPNLIIYRETIKKVQKFKLNTNSNSLKKSITFKYLLTQSEMILKKT
ncbi:unnamed protein product [Paramecium pentaurelia]|uniref:Uncharacterized protein n=1 Tax=Paramecium pentaurelia TaxID=43138 RepID=A0A8S1TI58_9CILI|nr:unnamed protein product [Paramecium pentaurelia]